MKAPVQIISSRADADGVLTATANCEGLGLRFCAAVTRPSGDTLYVDQPVYKIEVSSDFRFRLIFGAGWPVAATELVHSLGVPMVLAELAEEPLPGVAWNTSLAGRPLPLVISEWLLVLSRP